MGCSLEQMEKLFFLIGEGPTLFFVLRLENIWWMNAIMTLLNVRLKFACFYFLSDSSTSGFREELICDQFLSQSRQRFQLNPGELCPWMNLIVASFSFWFLCFGTCKSLSCFFQSWFIFFYKSFWIQRLIHWPVAQVLRQDRPNESPILKINKRLK